MLLMLMLMLMQKSRIVQIWESKTIFPWTNLRLTLTGLTVGAKLCFQSLFFAKTFATSRYLLSARVCISELYE